VAKNKSLKIEILIKNLPISEKFRNFWFISFHGIEFKIIDSGKSTWIENISNSNNRILPGNPGE